jgi:signal transduction histidine kinase
MKNSDISLKTLIFDNQRKAILIPLIIITLMIFTSLFFLLFFISLKHKSIYLKESEKNILNLTKQTSLILNENLAFVATLNYNLAKAHQHLLNNPSLFVKKTENLVKSKNGSLYKKTNLNDETVVYCSKKALNIKSETEMIKLTASIEYLYKIIVQNNNTISSAYYASVKGFFRAYPFIENIDKKIGPNLELEGTTLFPKYKKTKSKLWSEVYKDPALGTWMISCITPVYKGNTLEGITGVDITIENLGNHLLKKWTSFNTTESFILDKKGRLIAAQDEIEGKLKLKKLINKLQKNSSGNFRPTSVNLLKLSNKQHVNAISDLLTGKKSSQYIDINNKQYFLTCHTIKENGWKLFSITEKSAMVKSLLNQLTLIKNIYYSIFAIIFVLTLFSLLFFIHQSRKLSAQIAYPIYQLQQSVKKASYGKFKIKKSNIEEINNLAMHFNSLINKLHEKQMELKRLNETIQQKFDKEVEKNREQERLVFQQAKLIQMGELIGNIAHQWRQPLNAVALIIQSLYITEQDGTLTSSFLESQCHKAMDIINQMSETINNFRDFFKADDREDIFKINSRLRETVKIIKTSFEDRNIKIIENYHNDCVVGCNRHALSQVILNIFTNAEQVLLERSIEEKVILIETKLKDNQLIIYISDSGGGIHANILQKIFNPFFTTNKQNNTGLGLYLTQLLVVQQLKGTITVKNKNFSIKNKNFSGACFKITIPVYTGN